VIVLADSSPLITLARAQYFDLLHEFYGEIIVSREVHDEITVAGAGLPGAGEIQSATWIRVRPSPSATPPLSPRVLAACTGLGAGERSIIFLASELSAGLVLIDEERARRAAKTLGLNVAGSIAVLERGARLGRVDDLRSVYLSLLEQGIRYDRGLLNQSLSRLGLAAL
jgi:predicted nucleic acid-binding protein